MGPIEGLEALQDTYNGWKLDDIDSLELASTVFFILSLDPLMQEIRDIL